VASVQIVRPSETPRIVKRPARRPPTSALRVVIAVSGPGATAISAEMARKAPTFVITCWNLD
jgi:hypothetical protein